MPSGTWNYNGSDNWSNAARWTSGNIANGAGFAADFVLNITSARTVTLDSNRTIEDVTFSDGGANGSVWTLGGASTLTLEGNSPSITTVTPTSITAVLGGVGGFTHSGGQVLSTSTVHTVSGVVSSTNTGARASAVMVSASTSLGNPVANIDVFPNASFSFPSVGSGIFYESSSGATIANDFIGNGMIDLRVFGTSARTYSFTGDLSGMTGTGASVVQSGLGVPTSGFSLRTDTPSGVSARSATAVLNSLPAQLVQGGGATTAAFTNIISYEGTGDTSLRMIRLWNQGASSWTTATTCKFEASGPSPVNLDLGILREADGNTSYFTTYRLGGTSTADNTVSGPIASNSGRLDIRKEDAGRWVFSGNNTYNGINDISGGTLSAQSNTALGAASAQAVSINNTGVLELSGGIELNKSASDVTILNTNNPVRSESGANTFRTRQLSLPSSSITSFDVADGNKLVLQQENGGVLVGSTAGYNKLGNGELELGNTNNTYNGSVLVSAGTLTVHNVFSQGTAQNLGAGTTAITLAGTLKFIGTSGFMNRSLSLTGPTPALDCSGSGNFEFQNATQTSEARTFTLTGTSTGVNEVKFALANTSFATGLAKDGTGNWIVSGALSYSGATDVNAGTLRLVRADGNTMTGAVTVDAGATLELVTDTLPGSSGSAGRVLGTGNVVVNGDVKTRGGVVQKGQMRYGGNLTFNSGAKLYIGAAA